MSDTAKKTGYAKHIIKCYKEELKYSISKKLMYELTYLDDRTKYYTDSLMKYCGFPYLYSALFHDPDAEDIKYIRNIAYDIMSFHHSDPFYAEILMKKANYESGFPDFDEWDKLDSKDYYGGDRPLLAAGSAHPNGYVREQCLRRFIKHDSMLNFIIYRLNDHVPEVQKAAREVLEEYLKRPDAERALIEAAPTYVECVRRRKRVSGDESFRTEKLDSLIRKVITENIAKLPTMVCCKAFEIYPDLLDRDKLAKVFHRERNGEQRVMLERTYMHFSHEPIPREELEMFMEDEYEGVRRVAYAYRFEHEGIWEGFEKLLCSKSRRIRKFAEQKLSARNFDIAAYCREHLPDTMLALSDTGTKEDIPLIRPYLDTHPCEALTALVRLKAEDTAKLVYDHMHSEDKTVAKTAYCIARDVGCFDSEILLSMINSETDRVIQWREICLLTKDGIWQVMPHLIRFARKYPKQNIDIIYLIKKNLGNKIRLPAELNNEIQQALRESQGRAIPVEVNNRIFFAISG